MISDAMMGKMQGVGRGSHVIYCNTTSFCVKAHEHGPPELINQGLARDAKEGEKQTQRRKSDVFLLEVGSV